MAMITNISILLTLFRYYCAYHVARPPAIKIIASALSMGDREEQRININRSKLNNAMIQWRADATMVAEMYPQ